MPGRRRAHGEGSIYQRADGMWLGSVELSTPTGARRRKTVSSRDYAVVVKKLRGLRQEVEAAGRDIASGSVTVEQWMRQWLDTVAAARVRPRTLATYRGYVDRYITPTLGKRRLDQVTPAHVRAMHAHVTGTLGLSSTTARQAHAILVKALADARREGYTTRDIGDLVDPPRKAAGNRGALTVEQAVQVLRAAADDPLGSRWAAALLLGARQGECLGLEWDRVDLHAGTVNLAWQLQRLAYRHGCQHTAGGWACGFKRAGSCPLRQLAVPSGFEYRPAYDGLVLTRPKSRAGQRLVPLFESMRAMLATYQQQSGQQSGLVWRRDDGRPIDPKDDSAAWHALLAAAEVPDVPLHAARHTTATLLRRGGVDLPTIGAIMGHSTAASTSGYLHLDLTLSRAAIDVLGNTLARGLESGGLHEKIGG